MAVGCAPGGRGREVGEGEGREEEEGGRGGGKKKRRLREAETRATEERLMEMSDRLSE